MIHNSNNIKYAITMKMGFLFGVTTARGTVLKSHCIMKVENHYFVDFFILLHFLFILQFYCFTLHQVDVI